MEFNIKVFWKKHFIYSACHILSIFQLLPDDNLVKLERKYFEKWHFKVAPHYKHLRRALTLLMLKHHSLYQLNLTLLIIFCIYVSNLPYFTEYVAHFFTLKMMLKYCLRTIDGR